MQEGIKDGGIKAENIHWNIFNYDIRDEEQARLRTILSLGEILTPRARVDQRLMYLWLIGSSDPSIIKLAYHQAESSIKWKSDRRGTDRSINTPSQQSKCG
jgi:hypothetical protein